MLGDFPIGEALRVIEQHQNDHLMSAAGYLVLLRSEGGSDLRRAQVGLPGQLPPRVRRVVEVFELLTAGHELWRDIARAMMAVRRPGARREHLHGQVRGLPLLTRPTALLPAFEVRHHLPARSDVVKHILELRSELIAALDLQLAQQRPLQVVRGRLAVEQSFGEMLLVVLLEEVFLREVSEKEDRMLQGFLDFLLGAPLGPLAESAVHEQRDVLWGPGVLVDEVFERVIQRLAERFVRIQPLKEHLVAFPPQLEKRADERVRPVLQVFRRRVYDLHSKILHVRGESQLQKFDTVDLHEQPVHPLEVVVVAVLEDVDGPRGAVDQGLGMGCDHPVFDDACELRPRCLVKIHLHSIKLLLQSRFGVLQVLGAVEGVDELRGFELVVVLRGLKEGRLEVLDVHFGPKIHHHDDDGSRQHHVRDLTVPLAFHHFEDRFDQPGEDQRPAHDARPPQVQAQLVHALKLPLFGVRLVQVHENLPDDGEALLVALVLVLDCFEERLTTELFYSVRNAAKMLFCGIFQTGVEPRSVFVHDHVVSIPMELFEAQAARTIRIDLLDRVLQQLPRFLRVFRI
mmetsp:Transcript_10333/g.28139  ORF Transcript_10333/g.28139 Transcript_10333/m.28139 type:complete len:571 (-) Transcript_10333:264-1976(-)